MILALVLVILFIKSVRDPHKSYYPIFLVINGSLMYVIKMWLLDKADQRLLTNSQNNKLKTEIEGIRYAIIIYQNLECKIDTPTDVIR